MTKEGAEAAPDAAELAATIRKIAERSQRIVGDFMARQDCEGDPLNIGSAFIEMSVRMLADPARIARAQIDLWNEYMELWKRAADRVSGQDAEPLYRPDKNDRRFLHADWEENPVFDYIKQSYLLTSRWMIDTVRETSGLDEETLRKVDFYTRQFVDALAPTNFMMTNPEVLRETIDSKGRNLTRGLSNLLDDLEKGKGRLRVKMVEDDAFELGASVAASPGKVIFQNDLMQLIQYAPRTGKVRERPLLIVPPWINKFYILDLREKNSFVKWAVEQGHTVFMISWVNPDGALADKTFEDYMFEGPLAAVDAAVEATGADKVNVIGYCIGGTLTAATLAYMAGKGDSRVSSATFFATLVDFEEPGELGVFIDEEQIARLEERMSEKGYLEGADMAATFNMLRANDLIWSFVVNNYLMGKDPFPFDLLFWNSDATRMPAAMHSFYLRNMYRENALTRPGGIALGGVPIDLGQIRTPLYVLASKEDHIAPWESVYAGIRLYGGRARFVLASSGHIAGVVNPPSAGRYSYRTNPKTPAKSQAWLKGSTERDGSWWPDWNKWIGRYAGGEAPAREPGAGPLRAIEDAPGSYVGVRSEPG